MTVNLCEDVKGALRERVLSESNSDQLLRESKNAEVWWDKLPGKRKKKVVSILGLDTNLTRKLFSQIDAEDQSEIEAYFTKHKGRVESIELDERVDPIQKFASKHVKKWAKKIGVKKPRVRGFSTKGTHVELYSPDEPIPVEARKKLVVYIGGQPNQTVYGNVQEYFITLTAEKWLDFLGISFEEDINLDESDSKDKLGTKISFLKIERGNQAMYGYQVGHIMFRIVPDRDIWRLDQKSGPWPWEAVTSKRYRSPQEAAKDAVGAIEDAEKLVQYIKKHPGQWLPPNWRNEDIDLDEAVKAGQYFVLVDISVSGGKLVKRELYHGVKKADQEAEKLNKQGRNVQVIDAMWYEPARAIMKAQGMIGEDEDFDEGCKTPGMKKRSKGKGRGLAKGKGKGPLGVPVGDKDTDWTEAVADRLRERVLDEEEIGTYLMNKIIPERDVRRIKKMSDEQTGALAMDVWRELTMRISNALGRDGEEALNRLSMKSNFQKDTSGLTRNNIFKAAHALGIKLPSYMF